MNPKVSVCIPAYNYARFLPQAIESVLSQSFGDFELLVIDDGSTDDTRDVVAGYAARDGRIVFRANPVNRGMVPNWNLCLRESRGEYVKFLFADDFLVSQDALGRMADILDADASVSLVASARHVIGPDSGIIETVSDAQDRAGASTPAWSRPAS